MHVISFAVALLQSAGAQKDAPPPLPPISAPPVAGAGGAAASALKPGVLPSDTDPKAQAAWERTCRGRLVDGGAAPPLPVHAFDLQIDVRHRSAQNQTNDSTAPLRLRYLSPRFLRMTTSAGRELLRGQGGDYLLDPTRHETIALTPTSRENTQDLRQLDETVGIAQNFVALTDPSALRIASLRLAPTAPATLPPSVAKRVSEFELAWLELRTPDFHLVGAQPRTDSIAPPPGASAPGSIVPPPGTPSLVRVWLGTNAKTGAVELALVDASSATSTLSSAAVLLDLRNYAPIDGYSMPQTIHVYDVDSSRFPPAFAAEPGTQLGVHAKSASLHPALQPADFEPR
jgi:hypothetical protein